MPLSRPELVHHKSSEYDLLIEQERAERLLSVDL
jgi:hypothetical protein